MTPKEREKAIFRVGYLAAGFDDGDLARLVAAAEELEATREQRPADEMAVTTGDEQPRDVADEWDMLRLTASTEPPSHRAEGSQAHTRHRSWCIAAEPGNTTCSCDVASLTGRQP